MQEYNFNTHTKRCGHAIREDREHIESAIKANYKVLGISDHCPHRKFRYLIKELRSSCDYMILRNIII